MKLKTILLLRLKKLAYGVFKDLARKTAVDKVLKDKAFNIAKHWKYERYQISLASVAHNLFDKKPQVVVLIMKLNKIKNSLKNYTKQLHLKKEEFILHLKTIFRVPI